MILGVDVSSYLDVLAHGGKFYDGDREMDPLDVFRQNGVDCMRIRVWNHPYSHSGEPYLAGNCDMDHYIRLGQMAKAKGYRLLLDFHYSDFWADPAKQTLPKAWEGMDADALIDAVYNYTKQCLLAACEADVAPNFVQVGNEITNGMLWPIGKLTEGEGTRGNYDTLCRLIATGCRACREVIPQAEIILHLERSGDKGLYEEYFTQMQTAGMDYDIIGVSYYPYWHGTPEALFDNLTFCRRFGKKIMVVELAYGFTDQPYVLHGKPRRLVIDSHTGYVPGFTERYPLTPAGQAAFLRDFLREAREHFVDGVFYWEPLWIPGEGICWASEAGQEYIREEGKSTENEWANQCLCDYEGRKLPAFDAYTLP